MKQTGPRNIGLGSIINYRFPITAISSILHRISGVLLFLLIPFMIWGLDHSLADAQSFAAVKETLTSGVLGFLMWVVLAGITYHLIAGIRHLLMDTGLGETMGVAKATSVLVIVLGVLAAIFWGVWLW